MVELEIHQDGDGSYRLTHDMTKRGLSITIAEGLATIQETKVSEIIDDFTQYVDPDALDRLFQAHPRDGERRGSGLVQLDIDGVRITVHADGEILLER